MQMYVYAISYKLTVQQLVVSLFIYCRLDIVLYAALYKRGLVNVYTVIANPPQEDDAIRNCL